MLNIEPAAKRFRHIKWVYDVDPSGEGFFCPLLVQKRRDYFALKALRPAECEAVYQCNPGARTGSIFVESDFRYFEAPNGLELGKSSPAVAQFIKDHNGVVAQGWDTAMSAASTADWSVCATALLVPCEEFHRESDAAILGTCDQHYDVYILDIYRARLDIGDLALKIREQALKWNPEKIVIEKKASGASAMQALANTGLPIEGIMPQENKRDRAINGGAGAGSVQGWFKSGRVIFPYLEPPFSVSWLPELIRELKDFTGEKGATDDQVDALVHVVSYGIREGSAGIQFPTDWQTPEQIDAQMRMPTGLGAIFSGAYNLNDIQSMVDGGAISDPFADRCARCCHFKENKKPTCQLHLRMVTALHSCDDFDDGTLIHQFPRF